MRKPSEVDNIKYMLDVAHEHSNNKKSIKKLNKQLQKALKWVK